MEEFVVSTVFSWARQVHTNALVIPRLLVYLCFDVSFDHQITSRRTIMSV